MFTCIKPNKSIPMKTLKIIIPGILSLLFVSSLWSQTADSVGQEVTARDTAWKAGGLLTFTFSQSAFSNWAAGGENSYALNSRLNGFLNYKLGKVVWENNLDLAYGFTNQKSTGFRKNDDFFELTSKYGYQAGGKWYYSAVLNLKSQFSRGYDYTVEPEETISDFLSPLYLNLALGMDYKPNDNFSAFLSPANLKLVYVNDTMFSDRFSIEAGENLRTEFGFIAKIKYQKEIVENIDFLTKLDVFYDYLETQIILEDDTERFRSPYVSWEVLINMQVFKALSVNLNVHLIYDETYRQTNDSGVRENPKIQLKEVFGVGLSLKF
jgi:hypothetical protein